MAPQSVSPTPATTSEQTTVMQAAWQRFVDRVEHGEQLDLAGQYVAKKTTAPDDPAERRAARPKFDAATAEFAQHYRVRNGEIVSIGRAGSAGKLYPEPCTDCELPPAPTVTSTFTSSVGKGGPGSILDLKIIFNNPSESATEIRDKAGYIMLNADLNKGAGGDYIYFAFSRDPQRQVPNEPDRYASYGDAAAIMRGFETKYRGGFWGSIPSPSSDFFNIWSVYQGGWARADLNSGSGGEYIYSYQTKNPNVSASADIVEVGVLSGNSDTIQPPAGWEKYPRDLNEGCGGDYIYFCYKH